MIRIVVPGPPPRKNAGGKPSIGRNRKTGKPMRIPMERTMEWRLNFYRALCSTSVGREAFRDGICSGIWAVRIDVYEKRKTKLSCGAVVGHGDFDSCIEPVVDSMKPKLKKVGKRMVIVSPGLFDDDDRIVEGTARKHYDKANPRVEITLTELDPQ